MFNFLKLKDNFSEPKNSKFDSCFKQNIGCFINEDKNCFGKMWLFIVKFYIKKRHISYRRKFGVLNAETWDE